jgi:flagellar FliL protein
MSKKVLALIIGSVLLILGIMGAGFYLMMQKMNQSIAQIQIQAASDQEEEEPEVLEPAMGPLYKMDTLIVNLADQGGKRYLRVTMELELSAPEVTAEIDTRLPQLRDAILMVLPSKQYSDIGTTEGKILLRDELIVKINGILKKGTVNTLYFTEFVVQ